MLVIKGGSSAEEALVTRGYDNILSTVATSLVGEHTVGFLSKKITDIQDEILTLLVILETQSTGDLFISRLSRIEVGGVVYPVGDEVKSILFKRLSSSQTSIANIFERESGGVSGEVFENALRSMYSGENEYMDMTLSAGAKPHFRKAGGIFEEVSLARFLPPDAKVVADRISSDMTNAFAEHVLSKSSVRKRAIFEKIGYVRIGFPLQGCGRLRLTLSTQRSSRAFSCRKIPTKTLPIEKFFLSEPVIAKMLSSQGGLYLASGAIGMGKTAMLATFITEYSKCKKLKIATIEDPIEYIFRHNNSIVNQIEIGEDIATVQDTISMLKTDDTDIAMLTEIRVKEDLQYALLLASMGITTLATIHTMSELSVLDLVIEWFGEDHEVTKTFRKYIRLIVHQSLVMKVTGGVTPVHGILNFGEEGMASEAKKIDLKMMSMRVETNNKNSSNDLYNLVERGIVSKEYLKELKDIDYKKYPANSHNASTMEGR